MDREHVESRAKQIVQQIIDDIEAAGGEEDPRETMRRVNQIPDPRIRGRVVDILHERRRAQQELK